MELIQNKLILIDMQSYMENSGGIVVMYYLANLLKQNNINVKMYNRNKYVQHSRGIIISRYHGKIIIPRHYNKNGNGLVNEIFSEYTDHFDVDNTIVVYWEGTIGNPLNAKYVIRWILSELGKNVDSNIHLSWNKNDLCYYFLSEKKINDSPEKLNNIYKFLTTIYLKPNTFVNLNQNRKGYCHIFKKSSYHKNLIPFHPSDSVEISFSKYDQLVEIFNKYEYFICYDPACFLIWIAGLCGCIPILHKLENISKEDYFTGKSEANSNLYIYYLSHPYTDYPGIAYGQEDIEHARNTLSLLPALLQSQINYTNDYCITNFINDINNFDNCQNTIANNYK